MKNFDDSQVTRRSALKATGGVLGGLALGAGTASSVAAQSTVYRYDELEALLVDVDADPPAFRRVRTSLFLPEPRLEDCNTDHPCSIDVLDFDSTIDDDDDNGDDDDSDDDTSGDDGGDDDDDMCPDYGAVTLLCHGATLSDTVALTGLVPDVLAQNAEDGFDFVVELTPSDETNVTDPESVSNPCPADDDDDAGGQDDGGDDQDDDDGNNGDDDADDGGDDDSDD